MCNLDGFGAVGNWPVESPAPTTPQSSLLDNLAITVEKLAS